MAMYFEESVMATLTLTIDDQVLCRARTRASELGTSVDAVALTHLKTFAGCRDRGFSITQFLEVVERSIASSRERTAWMRDEIHER